MHACNSNSIITMYSNTEVYGCHFISGYILKKILKRRMKLEVHVTNFFTLTLQGVMFKQAS